MHIDLICCHMNAHDWCVQIRFNMTFAIAWLLPLKYLSNIWLQ